jgi:hypothetical protein
VSLFKALIQDVAIAVNERVAAVERENEKLQTALDCSKEEARAAWAALEELKKSGP